MAADREVSKGIVVNPNRMGGEPTVRGTRVDADMIARLMDGPNPMEPQALLQSYPMLTWNDLANVRGWDRRRRRG